MDYDCSFCGEGKELGGSWERLGHIGVLDAVIEEGDVSAGEVEEIGTDGEGSHFPIGPD